jgi:hypothetical protein
MPDNHFKPLPWTKLRRGVPCYLPKAAVGARVDAQSPALAVMADFRRFAPVTIARDAALDEANRLMTLCNVHYLLVGDEQRQLLGIVTEASTKGHRPLATAHAMGIRPRELVVGNVMINKHDDAEVVHLKDLSPSTTRPSRHDPALYVDQRGGQCLPDRRQVIAGIVAHSQGLIADGLHSLSDLVCDFLVLFAAHHSKDPADESHPYGHARIETAASFALGAILAATGAGIIWSAGDETAESRRPAAGGAAGPVDGDPGAGREGGAVPLHAACRRTPALADADRQRLACALRRRLLAGRCRGYRRQSDGLTFLPTPSPR